MGSQCAKRTKPSEETRARYEAVLHHRITTMYAILAAPRDKQIEERPKGHEAGAGGGKEAHKILPGAVWNADR